METNKRERVEIIKNVEPLGYQEDMQKLKQLEEENNRLKLFLKYGEVSLVESTVQEFQAFSKAKLKKIVREFQLLNAGQHERESILSLIAFLEEMSEELENLINI